MTDISNKDDIIDSRDVIERIDELIDIDQPSTEEVEELAALKALASEASGYAPDWNYGEVLIRDSYFKDYAMQLAEDIGAINPVCDWLKCCIDWDLAARELQYDYTAVEFDGVAYWIR